MKRVLGYVRVSTTEQGDSGAGLEAQRRAIQQRAAERGWQIVAIRQDIGSGRTLNGRHALKQALSELKAHGADGLVVAKLDRLSRSIHDFSGLLEMSRKQGWALVALDFDLDTSTPAGELVANVMASVAQWERRIIGQRTKEGLAVKRAQGVRLGRPRTVPPELEHRIIQRRRAGSSFAAIAAELTTDGIPTPMGGSAWSWATVQRVVRRHLSETVRRR